MKRKFTAMLAGMLVLSMTAGMLAAQAAEPAAVTEAAEETAEESYAGREEMAEKIATVKKLINEGFGDVMPEEEEISPVYQYGPEGAFGYAMVDLDGDGEDDLVIGDVSEDGLGVLFDLYLSKPEGLVHLASGGERDTFQVTEDGLIIEQGSSSAACHVDAVYEIKDDGLVLKEAIIYDATVNENEPYFRSTEGLEADEAAEAITEEEAEKILDAYEQKSIMLTPFTED